MKTGETCILADFVGTRWCLMDSQWYLELKMKSSEDGSLFELTGCRTVVIFYLSLFSLKFVILIPLKLFQNPLFFMNFHFEQSFQIAGTSLIIVFICERTTFFFCYFAFESLTRILQTIIQTSTICHIQ